jgi:hypothetical protein
MYVLFRCTTSTNLVSNFVDDGTSSTSATIEAFKFYSNDHVFLTCNVKVCPAAGAANCAVSIQEDIHITDM